jgi:hypothetical protein
VVFLVVLATRRRARGSATPRPELVPVAFAAVLFSILFDARISLVAAMVLAVLIASQGPFRGTNALFIMLVAGVAAAMSVAPCAAGTRASTRCSRSPPATRWPPACSR